MRAKRVKRIEVRFEDFNIFCAPIKIKEKSGELTRPVPDHPPPPPPLQRSQACVTLSGGAALYLFMLASFVCRVGDATLIRLVCVRVGRIPMQLLLSSPA